MMLNMCAFHLAAALTMSLFVWMARLTDRQQKTHHARVLDVPNVQNSLIITENTSAFRKPVRVKK